MKAKELRIGNYVYNNHLKVNKRISGIFDYEIWLSKVNEDEHDQRSFIEDNKPIPLDEEWLLKFEIKVGKWFQENSFMITKPIEKEYNEWDFWIRNANYNKKLCITYCKYVHQLQNLYFALTNEELTIKE